MNIYTVSFFGHRMIDNPIKIERQLERWIRQFITEQEFVEFLVGRNGDFDQLVSSAVRRIRRDVRKDNSALILVLPYMTAEYRHDEAAFHAYYNEVRIFETTTKTHYKSAFRNRNQAMIRQSDCCVSYVERDCGGPFQTIKYAESIGIPVINLAKEQSCANVSQAICRRVNYSTKKTPNG